MASKDWIKVKDNYGVKDWIRYKSQRYGGLTVEISKNTTKNTWIVYENNQNYISKIKENIKTKSAALKFAKAYMRTH